MATEHSIPRSGAVRILSRAGQGALLWALLVMLLPGATLAAVPVALYPVQGPATEKSRAEVGDLLAAGMPVAEHRQVFTARTPFVVSGHCASPITPRCLAKLAGPGVIIYGFARDKETAVDVTLELITADGQRTKPIQFQVGKFFRDDRIGIRAIEALETAYLRLTATQPSTSTLATPMPAPVPTVASASAPSAKPALVPQGEAPAAAMEPVEVSETHSRSWMKPAAISFGAAGAAVFGGGLVFGLLAKNLNQDLTDRYKSQQLVASDGSKYSRLHTYNTLATAMMIGGGALAAAGVTFWALSPSVGASSDGASFSIEGSF